ncbi:hypothetical protein [Bradyrhizobium sp.]|uniref:hypothetical protein n=1 Tax=Bradyrhizobium sp. TaxID=376 RepID=UPI00262CA4F3|nr:hypothetical protein [Bradyrhizobium sp.]
MIKTVGVAHRRSPTTNERNLSAENRAILVKHAHANNSRATALPAMPIEIVCDRPRALCEMDHNIGNGIAAVLRYDESGLHLEQLGPPFGRNARAGQYRHCQRDHRSQGENRNERLGATLLIRGCDPIGCGRTIFEINWHAALHLLWIVGGI